MLGVSVIMPCFNAGPYISEAIESVLNQKYEGELEILVADDGSTDDSRDIVKQFGEPVRLFTRSPVSSRGPSAARNRAIARSNQPLIAFLDADDIWLPGHLGEMAKVMEMRPEIGIAYDKGYFISVEGKILSPMFFEPHKPTVTPDDLLPNQCFGVGSVVVRHSALENTGDFDESICGAEDHDLWLRIMEKYPATHVPLRLLLSARPFRTVVFESSNVDRCRACVE